MTLNQCIKQIQTTSLVFTLIFSMAPNLVQAISKPTCPDYYELDMVTYLNSPDCEDPKDFNDRENAFLATEDAETSPQLGSLNPSSIVGGDPQVPAPPAIAIDDPNAAELLAEVLRVGARDRSYTDALFPYYQAGSTGSTSVTPIDGEKEAGLPSKKKL